MVDIDHGIDLYPKLRGHVFTETREGIIEVWWTESHSHDVGANEVGLNIIMNAFKFSNKNDEHSTNRKVSLTNPIIKERAAKHVIFDVQSLMIDEEESLQFLFAFVDYYKSNFWIQFEVVGLISWFILSFVATMVFYYISKSY